MTSYSPAVPGRRRILRGGAGHRAVAASFAVPLDLNGDAAAAATIPERLEAARQAAYDKGYRTAVEEAAQAENAGRAAQLRRVADALVAAAAQVREARAEAVQVAGREAVELACQLAEAILQRELSAADSVLEALQRAVALVPDADDLVVRLNPGDTIAPADLERLVPNANVRVLHDARVERGSCVVVAGPCRIDTQIGAALERARRVLDELYPDRPAAPAAPAAEAVA